MPQRGQHNSNVRPSLGLDVIGGYMMDRAAEKRERELEELRYQRAKEDRLLDREFRTGREDTIRKEDIEREERRYKDTRKDADAAEKRAEAKAEREEKRFASGQKKREAEAQYYADNGLYEQQQKKVLEISKATLRKLERERNVKASSTVRNVAARVMAENKAAASEFDLSTPEGMAAAQEAATEEARATVRELYPNMSSTKVDEVVGQTIVYMQDISAGMQKAGIEQATKQQKLQGEKITNQVGIEELITATMKNVDPSGINTTANLRQAAIKVLKARGQIPADYDAIPTGNPAPLSEAEKRRIAELEAKAAGGVR